MRSFILFSILLLTALAPVSAQASWFRTAGSLKKIAQVLRNQGDIGMGCAAGIIIVYAYHKRNDFQRSGFVKRWGYPTTRVRYDATQIKKEEAEHFERLIRKLHPYLGPIQLGRLTEGDTNGASNWTFLVQNADGICSMHPESIPLIMLGSEVKNMPKKQQLGLLGHEIGHIVALHPVERKNWPKNLSEQERLEREYVHEYVADEYSVLFNESSEPIEAWLSTLPDPSINRSTHPSPNDRIARLDHIWPMLQEYIERDNQIAQQDDEMLTYANERLGIMASA
jgi:hypothetical protein